MTLEEAIKYYEGVAREYLNLSKYNFKSIDCQEYVDKYCQLAEWLKRLKRIEDYIADGKDDMECTYSLCFWEIEAVMNGEI